eukprot:184463_1
MSVKLEHLVFLVLWLIIFYFMSLPIMLYYLRLYYLNRNHPIIHKRYYYVVILIVFVLILLIAIDKSFYIIALTIANETSDLQDKNKQLPYILSIISSILYLICTPSVGCAFAARAYLLYYDHKWMLASNKGRWAHLITDYYKTHTNWYIKHRATFGNPKFVFSKILIPICIVCSLLVLTAKFVSQALGAIIVNLIYIFLIVFILVIYHRIPTHSTDCFLIKKEIKMQLILGLLTVIFTTIYVIFKDFAFNGHRYYFFICPAQIIFTTIYVLVALVSTRWVMIDSGLSFKRDRNEKQEYSRTISISTTRQTSPISLRQILKSREGFEAFFNFVFSEFSSESLLCIVECFQWKSFIQSIASATDTLNLDSHLEHFSLPTHNGKFPMSAIVYNEELKAHEKFNALIEKYISGFAVYEVNISFVTRTNLMNLYQRVNQTEKGCLMFNEEMNKQELYVIFDQVLSELISLLKGSKRRFVLTDAFLDLEMQQIEK